MISFLYDLFYILPLNIGIILAIFGVNPDGSIRGLFGQNANVSIAVALMTGILSTLLVLILRHLEKKERNLSGGIFIVVIFSLFWIIGPKKRLQLINEYSWIVLIILVTALAIIIGKIAEKSIAGKIIVSAVMITYACYMMIQNEKIPKKTVEIFLAIILIYIMEIVQRYWRKSGNTELKTHVVYISPILIALCVIISTVPTPSKAFDWKFAKNIWKEVVTEYNYIKSKILSGDEEYGYTGFSGKGGFSGSINENDREVMLIKCDGNKENGALYLSGISYDSFIDCSWKNEYSDEIHSKEFDYIETETAILKNNIENERDYFITDTAQMENRLFNTKYIFTPEKANLFSVKTLLPEYVENESMICAKSKIKYKKTYSVGFMELNLANPDLTMLASSAEPISEEEWDKTLFKYGVLNNEMYSYENYRSYVDNIYTKYGGTRIKNRSIEEAIDNSEISDNVKQILKSVIEEKSCSDYELLRYLADYLQTFKYNKNSKELPSYVNDENSFLDYLLLELKEGYCVHFATAFTLLARQLGYPARYVQGYYVRPGKNPVLIDENCAHAWTEIYFDNFGWVRFEVTLGYEKTSGWSYGGMVNGQNERPAAYKENTIPTEAAEGETEEAAKMEDMQFIYAVYIVIPIISALVFGCLFLFISRIVAEKKYNKMDNRNKAVYLINRNIRILKLLGYPLREMYTLDEYRIQAMKNADICDNLTFLEIYEKILYANADVSEEDIENMEEEYTVLKQVLKKKSIRYRFYPV